MIEVHAADVSESCAWPRLLADIGGTNARFAWQAGERAELSHVRVLPCAAHSSLVDAVRGYLARTGLPVPGCAAFAMANPVTGDRVTMTNLAWSFSLRAVRAELGLQRLLVLNDFTALALAVPHLPAAVLHRVGGGQAAPHAAIGLIGPGTGLGVSGLVPVPGHARRATAVDDGRRGMPWAPIVGEGGHVSLSAGSAREFAVIEWLRRRYGHASAERALCGAGLVDLYRASCETRGVACAAIATPAQLLEQALREPGSTADDALGMFCAFLGSVAGDLALTLGARGGVYVGGGIVPRMPERFARSAFRERFEAKGRFSDYLSGIPTWVIDAPVSPALTGASLAMSMHF